MACVCGSVVQFFCHAILSQVLEGTKQLHTLTLVNANNVANVKNQLKQLDKFTANVLYINQNQYTDNLGNDIFEVTVCLGKPVRAG